MLVFLLVCAACNRGEPQNPAPVPIKTVAAELPRNLGPFSLGMTPDEFKKITGIEPEDCPRCDDNEEYAGIDDKMISKFISVSGPNSGMDAFFFKGKLYRAGALIGNEKFNLQKYVSKFGKPLRSDEAKGTYEWEDKKTVIRINYAHDADNGYVLEYNDKSLEEQHYLQEKDHPTNPGAH